MAIICRIPKFGHVVIEVNAGAVDEPETPKHAGVRFSFAIVVEADGPRHDLTDLNDYYEAVKFARETAAWFGVPHLVNTGLEGVSA
jgi:hypothetical protein